MEVKGSIKKILPKLEGEKKDGSGSWVKQEFVVANNDGYEGREQLFCFEVFGSEKVDNFNKYNKEGSQVVVAFNIRTNEYKEKYYTSLQAWNIKKSDSDQPEPFKQIPESDLKAEESDDLPF